MNVSMTPELEHPVNEEVNSGLYQTASEVVREALRLAGVPDVRGGAVAIVQRFGGAMNRNVHVHALGPRAGRRPRLCGAVPVEDQVREDQMPGPVRCHAREERFDPDACVRVPADHRARLERLCRYAPRKGVAQDRLHQTAKGPVVLRLRHPWSDGTTHLLFDPLDLLALSAGHPRK